MADLFGKVVYSYTREQALEDGILVDITAQAAENRIKIPTAITSTLYYSAIDPQGVAEENGESTTGRLADLFFLFIINAAKNRKSTVMFFPFLFTNETGVTEEQRIKAVVSGGDSGEPVLTFMLSEED